MKMIPGLVTLQPAGSESRNFEAFDFLDMRGEAVHGEVDGVCCSHAA